MKEMVTKKRLSIALSIVLVLALVIWLVPMGALAEQGDAQQTAKEDITLATLWPQAFPAEGKATDKVDTLDAPNGEAKGALEAGDTVQVVDYAQGCFLLKSGEYVAESGLNISFAQPVAGKVLAEEGYAYTQKKEAQEDNQCLPLVPGNYMNVTGIEDGWWVIVDMDGNKIYAQHGTLSIAPNIAQQFMQKGEYGTDKVQVIQGDVVIGADVTLSNMVIEGNLYILDGVKKVTLNDAYVSRATLPLGSVEIENNMGKILDGVGNPAKMTSKLFRGNYPEVDVEQLLQDAQELIQGINTAVFADGEVE